MTETHGSRPFDGVPDEVLECLVGWPEGTKGYNDELVLVGMLNALCKKHGYGFVLQLAACIEDIWRRPERAEHYKRQQQARVALLRDLLPDHPSFKSQTTDS